jgi:hypothetical protein
MLNYRTPRSPRPSLIQPNSQPDRPPAPSTRGPACGCNEWITDWWMLTGGVIGTAAPADVTPPGAASVRATEADGRTESEGHGAEGLDHTFLHR